MRTLMTGAFAFMFACGISEALPSDEPPAQRCGYAGVTEFAPALREEGRDVVKELLRRIDNEQRCMLIIAEADPATRKRVWPIYGPIIQRMVRENAEWLKDALVRAPLLSRRYSGDVGSTAAWLMIQHSDHDPEWQRSMVPVIRRLVEANDLAGSHYAMLVDRVAVNSGQLQTYGSQGMCGEDGAWHPKPISDPANVDTRRAAVGLSTMQENIKRFRC